MKALGISLIFQKKTVKAKLYLIFCCEDIVGELEFKVVGCTIIVHNVIIQEEFKGKVNLWRFFKLFDDIEVFDELEEAENYWYRLGANIISRAKVFEPVIFEEGENE